VTDQYIIYVFMAVVSGIGHSSKFLAVGTIAPNFVSDIPYSSSRFVKPKKNA